MDGKMLQDVHLLRECYLKNDYTKARRLVNEGVDIDRLIEDYRGVHRNDLFLFFMDLKFGVSPSREHLYNDKIPIKRKRHELEPPG